MKSKKNQNHLLLVKHAKTNYDSEKNVCFMLNNE